MTTRTPIIFDTTIYVATTGDDNNAGTQSSPFRTIQHAVDFICFLADIQADVNITIQVADGTYTEEITLYNFLGSVRGDPALSFTAPIVIQGNDTNPENVILTGLANPINDAVFAAYSVANPWKITGFTIAPIGGSDGVDVWNSHDVTLGVINFGECGANNIGPFDGRLCVYVVSGQCSLKLANITISGFGWRFFSQVSTNAFLDLSFCSFNITASVSFDTFIFCGQESAIACNNSTFNLNGNTVTGKRFHLLLGGKVLGVSQNLNFFPGDTAGILNNTSDYDGIKFIAPQQISSLPTTSNLSSGFAGVFKDTSGGGVYLAYNDNGTIKTVTLT